jgi:hypothetical protein
MKVAILVFALLSSINGFCQGSWPAITNTAKPWTRWWWMGSAVDGKNIQTLLQQYGDAGLGGVEVVPIYGAKGFESRYIHYLSPQWMKILDTTTAIARKLGMGVDVSVGTGWPIGGPEVSITDAATRLHIQRYTLKAGNALTDKIIFTDKKQSNETATLSVVMAYSENGTIKDLTNSISKDGTLNWKPEEGNWEIIAAFTAKTLQKVKRAAPGGEGYTLDHFSPIALANYFAGTDKAFGSSAHGVRAFYNDSYEVYGADWTPDFFNTFQNKRGYDLKPFLRELISKDETEKVSRIKSDYRATISDLMLENFSNKFSDWAHSKKALSTNQAHGSPGNLLDLYSAVDIAETETFGSSFFPISGLRRDSADVRNVDPDPTMLKFASSAAHASGHNLTSCETFTWLTEHFKTSWAQCKPELEQVFLSGINHVFFHGTTYSPADASWPGWLFYASVNFVPNNSLWPHLKGLNEYIARCQSVLQSGTPDNEVAIYWPIYDVWQSTKGLDKPLKVHDVDEWLHPTPFYQNVMPLEKSGYSIDFLSDRMIQKAKGNKQSFHIVDSGAKYKVLIVPACDKMPVETFEKIIQLANSGTYVIFEKMPLDVPGFSNLAANRNKLNELISSVIFNTESGSIKTAQKGAGAVIVSDKIKTALESIGLQGEAISNTGLKFIRRSITDGKYYYVVNHTATDIDTTVAINFSAKSIIFLDPQTGDQGLVKATTNGKKTVIRLQVKSGEALIVKATNKAVNIPIWNYIEKEGENLVFNDVWKVSFTNGGPALPKPRTISKLDSWTEWQDTTLQNFSGSALYTNTFSLPNKKADDYLLRLGKVCESARVWINGKEAGLLWSIPYERKIGHLLVKGKNEIKIEVANLMANRISYMDRNHISWRNYHEINFVNINYKDFNAASWKPQPSGLLGPVTITAFDNKK